MASGSVPPPLLASARLTVDLSALADNWRTLAALAPGAETAAVVKANAYGIGADRAIRALTAAGCRTFFVATPEEGGEARVHDALAAVYILDGLPPGGARTFAGLALRPVLGSMAEINEWATWKRGGGAGDCAIHIDTGMNRLGLTPDETRALAAEPGLVAALKPAVVMTHLASADTPASPMNEAQRARFEALAALFPGVPRSMANSAGILLGPPYQFALTRPGIMLYGARGAEGRPPLKPVVTAEACILRLRDVPAGATVGYGATQSMARPSRLATLGAGYADGYLRSAGSSNGRAGAHVLIGGRRAPLVGRVSMDLMVADVTDIAEAREGDWAELFGPNLPIDDVAAAAGTIAYELLTGLGRRGANRYLGGPGG